MELASFDFLRHVRSVYERQPFEVTCCHISDPTFYWFIFKVDMVRILDIVARSPEKFYVDCVFAFQSSQGNLLPEKRDDNVKDDSDKRWWL